MFRKLGPRSGNKSSISIFTKWSCIIHPLRPYSCMALSVGQLQDSCARDWCSWRVVSVHATRNQMEPAWWSETDNQTTSSVGHSPITVSLLFGHIARMPDKVAARRMLMIFPSDD